MGKATWLAGCKGFQTDNSKWGIFYRTMDLVSSMNSWDGGKEVGSRLNKSQKDRTTKKVNTELPDDPAIPLVGIQPEELKRGF